MSTVAEPRGIPWRAKVQFPGYRLPEELVSLREQVRRIVQDEIVPIEQRIDPDAPDLPEEDWRRLAAKTRAAGLWCLGAPEEYGGGGSTRSRCASSSRRWRSTGWASTTRAGACSAAIRPP